MRSIIYAEAWDHSIVDRVLKEMERIDSGFGFSQALGKNVEDKKGDEHQTETKTDK